MSLWHANMKTEGVNGKLLLLALAHDSSDMGAMLPRTLCEAQRVLKQCWNTFLGLRLPGGGPRYKNRPGFPYGFPITEIQLIKPQLGRVTLVLTRSCGVSALGLVSEPVPSETRSSLRISGQYWIKFIHSHLVADSPSTDAGVYNLHLISPSFISPPGIQGETKPGKDRKDG